MAERFSDDERKFLTVAERIADGRTVDLMALKKELAHSHSEFQTLLLRLNQKGTIEFTGSVGTLKAKVFELLERWEKEIRQPFDGDISWQTPRSDQVLIPRQDPPPDPMGTTVHETIHQYIGGSPQPRDDAERDKMLAEYASAGLSQPIKLPPPDVQRRYEIGRRPEARQAYAQFGEHFIRWAADDFRKRFNSYRRKNNCGTSPDDREKCRTYFLQMAEFPDAKGFLHSDAGSAANEQTLYLTLCAAEEYYFLRQFEAPQRPPFPFWFIINEGGLYEAARLKKEQTAARKRASKAKDVSPSASVETPAAPVSEPAPSEPIQIQQSPGGSIAGLTVNVHVNNSSTNTNKNNSSAVAKVTQPSREKKEEPKTFAARLKEAITKGVLKSVEAKVGALVAAAAALVGGILWSEHPGNGNKSATTKPQSQAMPLVHFDPKGRFSITELKPDVDAFDVNTDCRARFVVSSDDPRPDQIAFSIEEFMPGDPSNAKTIADQVKSGAIAVLKSGWKYRVHLDRDVKSNVSITVVGAD